MIYIDSPSANAEPTWTKIYETVAPSRNNASSSSEITYVSGFGKTGGAASAFIAAGTSWDYIKIRMEMTRVSNSTKYFTEVYFDKWAGAQITDLQFPDYVNLLVLQKNVTNLVVTSDWSGVKTGSFALGRIEIWPYNYDQTRSGLSPPGDAASYDWDDKVNVVADGWGSYQVHNLTDTQTIMAWNNHSLAGYGQQVDLGFASAPSGNPDWTFGNSLNLWNKTNFKVQVFVGTAISASTINAPVVTGAQVKGLGTTLTVTASAAGKVTFYTGTRRIPGCIGVITATVLGNQTATCLFKPSTSGPMKYWARLTPTSSSITGSTSPVIAVQIGRRTGTR
jgi:hypothetical protein